MAYQLKKSKDISKDLEDSLPCPEEPPSTTSTSTTSASVASAFADKTSSSSTDPLLLFLERPDSMQGRLLALEKGNTSVSSFEVNIA